MLVIASVIVGSSLSLDVQTTTLQVSFDHTRPVRADCLATNTEYCNRCTHTATQATNMAQINTKRNQGLTQGTRWLG
jgi:hypothetical protein